MSIVSRMLDGKDTRIEANAVLASLSVLAALVFAGWTVIKQGQPFDVQSFGIGMGALFGGVGAASWGRGQEVRDMSTGKDDAASSRG